MYFHPCKCAIAQQSRFFLIDIFIYKVASFQIPKVYKKSTITPSLYTYLVSVNNIDSAKIQNDFGAFKLP